MMPIGDFDFRFRAINIGFCECDWKTDGGVRDLVVVGIVVYETTEVVGVEFNFAEKDFCQASFVVVPFRGLHGQTKEISGVQSLGRGKRTGKQDVLERWRLENAVVGKMQHQTGGWEKASDRQTRLDGLFVQDELIVIPAKAGVNGPISEADQILGEGGLFKAGACSQKAKIYWR